MSENDEKQAATETPAAEASAPTIDLAEKYKNDFLYLRAEFENYKRHAIKERSDLTKFGAERFIKDLLPVLDNFERAMQVQATAENYKTVLQGVQMTSAQIKDLLTKHGVQELPAEGSAFDPAIHEALSSELNDNMPAGHVSKVFQKAYKMHEKLLRPAQVVVATNSTAQ